LALHTELIAHFIIKKTGRENYKKWIWRDKNQKEQILVMLRKLHLILSLFNRPFRVDFIYFNMKYYIYQFDYYYNFIL